MNNQTLNNLTYLDITNLIYALRMAMIVISQHYPDDIECCKSKIDFIQKILKKYEE